MQEQARRVGAIDAVARPILLALVALFIVVGCSRAGYEVYLREGKPSVGAPCEIAVGCAAGAVCAGGVCSTGNPWTEYLAQLDVPDCPVSAHETLIVDTLVWEIDVPTTATSREQAGATLSLAEALWISENRAGPDTIRFDPAVFSLPTANRIILDCTTAPAVPTRQSALCIDGRGAHVAVDWDTSSGYSCAVNTVWGLYDGSLQVGLALLNPGFEQVVASGSRLAGCRVGTDGVVPYGLSRWGVQLEKDAILGPGNILAPVDNAVRLLSMPGSVGAPARIEGNYFGYDPITPAVIPTINAIDTREDGDIADNVFAVAASVIDISQGIGDLRIERNFFGTDATGTALPGTFSGVVTGTGAAVVGPDNVFRGLATAAITIGEVATVTRNIMYENAAGIVGSSVVAPTIDTVSIEASSDCTRYRVSGTCAESGTVELCEDRGAQCEHPLNATACTALGFTWSTALCLTAGWNITATLTNAAQQTSGFSAPVVIPMP